VNEHFENVILHIHIPIYKIKIPNKKPVKNQMMFLPKNLTIDYNFIFFFITKQANIKTNNTIHTVGTYNL